MDWLVIEGGTPYDGRYQFDIGEFTVREWGWIKRLGGYMPATIGDGFKGADPELYMVFAMIALHRAGRVLPADVPDAFDRLSDSRFGTTVRLELGQEEGDADPPPSNSSSNGATSGPDSTASSEASTAVLPRPSGMPGSASSPSVQQTSPT